MGKLIQISLFSVLFAGHLCHAQEQVKFGRFQSRAIFNSAPATSCPAPLVVLIPGSGPNGPEEMIPGLITGDGKDHSIFVSFSDALLRAKVGTLAIGKPGVEFFKSWDPKDRFYDSNLYLGLGWQDMIDNLADAVAFAKTLPCVDPNHIVLLGHSEGTQIASDFATAHPQATSALVLIGFAGENLHDIVDWQFFRRPIDAWISPDVDTNHDGFVSQAEAKAWPEFEWTWPADRDKVSLVEIEQKFRADKDLQQAMQKAADAKIWQGVFNRPPLYDEIVHLTEPVYVFTGELDVQTVPEQSLRLQGECEMFKKENCTVQIVAGLGHGMSKPRQPRGQKLLDATIGPVDDSFLLLLEKTASTAGSF